jgi:putative transposase
MHARELKQPLYEVGACQFWQSRFYDFNVWSQKKFVEKLQHMHMNPLKRKLVAHPKDWPWSSFSFYAKSDPALVRIDPIA